MVSILREDFKQGTVDDSPLGAAATIINSADFADLGAVVGGSGQIRKLILDPSGINGDPEVVYVTAHLASSAAVTVERGRENTVARSHPSGTIWKHGPTSRDFGDHIGDFKLHAGPNVSEYWLLCDGQEVSRVTYNLLFEAIGTTYGVGDGSTTFNVPDFRGRVPIGVGTLGPDTYVLGDTVGEASHVLTTTELPSHNHDLTGTHNHGTGSLSTANDGSHNHGNTDGNGGHSHTQRARSGSGSTNTAQTTTAGSVITLGSNTTSVGNHTHSISSGGSHTHNVTGTSGTANAGNTGSAGSGTAHENRQPSLAVNFFIFAGV